MADEMRAMPAPSSIPHVTPSGIVRPSRWRRVACSGSARRVLDYIDRQELAHRRTTNLTLPLQPDVYAVLQYEHPMTDREWNQMRVVLEAMKLGIVR